MLFNIFLLIKQGLPSLYVLVRLLLTCLSYLIAINWGILSLQVALSCLYPISLTKAQNRAF